MKVKRVFDGRNRSTEKKKVYIQVYESRTSRSLFDTGVKIRPSDWDIKREEVSRKHPTAAGLNSLIINKETEILQAIQKLSYEGKQLTISNLKTLLSPERIEKPFFTSWALEKLQDLPAMRPGYIKHVRSVIKSVEDYHPGLLFDQITLEWIEKYHRYLLNSGLKPGSTRNHHKQIRKFYKLAANHKIASLPSPYDNFKIPSDRGRRIALTPEEVSKIKTIQPSTSRLTHVRDVFLFACYTGLAFTDLATLEPKHIISTNSQLYIQKRRNKLNENEPDTVIPLINQAKEILQRYEGGKHCLPVYANATYNEYLKEIAALVGIEFNLTSHVARHTFATIALNSGIPIETVSKLLGHNSVKTTQIYAKILREKLTNDIKNLENAYK